MQKLGVSFIAIGSELLDGRVLDTNSKFIAEELSKVGLSLKSSIICDDVKEEIIDSLNYSTKNSNFIVITGGLGPTSDDITRDVVAEYVGSNLTEFSDSKERLIALYEKRKRVMDPSNLKQTFFPKNSKIILNSVGTAEGFHTYLNDINIFVCPGVPKEFKPMWKDYILPYLKTHVELPPIYRKSFRVFGLPESNIGSIIKSLEIPKSIFVSYRANFPEIHVTMKGTETLLVDKYIEIAKDKIGREYIFIEDQEKTLPEVICEHLLNSNITISVAESCTGGLLGSYLTKLPGSSKYFSGGFLTYSNELKKNCLSVKEETLNNFGAVSENTAIEMAENCRLKTNSDIGISITGIAGPGGGSEEKPVGTFYVGLSLENKIFAKHFFFLSEREGIRLMAVYQALDLIRRNVMAITSEQHS
jgi:nicotinamide-nucleotide amidase